MSRPEYLHAGPVNVTWAVLLAARDGAIPLSHELGTRLASTTTVYRGVALVWLPIYFSVLHSKWKEIGIVIIAKEGYSAPSLESPLCSGHHFFISISYVRTQTSTLCLLTGILQLEELQCTNVYRSPKQTIKFQILPSIVRADYATRIAVKVVVIIITH